MIDVKKCLDYEVNYWIWSEVSYNCDKLIADKAQAFVYMLIRAKIFDNYKKSLIAEHD